MNEVPVLLQSPSPGAGHNQPPQAIDPIDALEVRLARTYRAMVVRFADLELACARVPDPIGSNEDAGATTDFVAQCQRHIKQAEAAHKTEKEFFLKAGRIVDRFFKPRCIKLTTTLGPVLERLNTRVATLESERDESAKQVNELAAERAVEEEAYHRAEAIRLASVEPDTAAQHLMMADAASNRAAVALSAAQSEPPPTQIHGDYGSTAYLRRTWTFEVVDLDQVPREYMSLDVEVVREAITRDAVREIPGLKIFQKKTIHVRGAG